MTHYWGEVIDRIAQKFNNIVNSGKKDGLTLDN
jgi:hypothetical protein